MAIVYSLDEGRVLPASAKTDLAGDISDATTEVGAAVAGVATGGTVDLTGYATTAYADQAEADAVTTAKSYTDQQVASVSAPDLTGYATETYVDSAVAGVAVPVMPPIESIPFMMKWNGTAWPYASLEEAVAAGLNPVQQIIFSGNTGGSMPAWARDGDVWTEG